MKKLLLIVNPISGKMKIKSSLLNVINIFTQAGFVVTVYITQHKGDASRCIKDQPRGDYDMYVICGGDGTLSEAISGLMAKNKEERTPLAFLPCGSTNDFASSHNIPKRPEDAAHFIAQGTPYSYDCGRFQDDFFVYVAAFGAFTDVSYLTPQNMKNTIGHSAYILGAVKSVAKLHSHSMRVTYDGQTIEGNFIYGMVSNSQSVAGLKIELDSDSDLCDGSFEVLLVKNPANPIELQAVINDILRRDFTTERFIFFKASQVSIECEDDVDWTIDGEFGGTHKRVDIQNMKKAFQLVKQIKPPETEQPKEPSQSSSDKTNIDQHKNG